MGHHFLIANEIQGNWQYGIPKKCIPERELSVLNVSPQDVCPCILSLIYDDAHTVYHSVLLPLCYRSLAEFQAVISETRSQIRVRRQKLNNKDAAL